MGCLSSAPAKVVITITSVNDAPVLATIGNKSIAVGATLSFTATAVDVDAAQTKIFSLITPPTGATINASTGAFSWRPTAAGTFTFKVRVTDNGSPVLFDEEQITVTVTASIAGSASPTLTAEENNIELRRNEGQEINKAKLTVYPNPAAHKLFISGGNFSNQSNITIMTTGGSVVYRKDHSSIKSNNLELRIDHLVPGQYFLQVKTEQGIQTLKFVKI
jgi:hypothetical protein